MAARTTQRTINAMAAGRDVVIGDHAVDEAEADGFLPGDVINVLETAYSVEPQDDVGLKWKAYGFTATGADYAVVVNVHADHLFVITCHFPP
jgi:hypothetical protein